MNNLILQPDGTVKGKGFTRLENLIANHRFQIGVRLLAAKAICESGDTEMELRNTELDNHRREINRRFAILSGLMFALGVLLPELKLLALQEKLGITEDELNELAQNAADTKPSYGGDHLN